MYSILELNWNQRLRDKKTKLNICHHMLTSSTQLLPFHDVKRTRTSLRCPKMRNPRAKRAKLLFFKYAKWCSCRRRSHSCLSSLFTVIQQVWTATLQCIFCFVFSLLFFFSFKSQTKSTTPLVYLFIHCYRFPKVPCVQEWWVWKCHGTVCLVIQSTQPQGWSQMEKVYMILKSILC